MAVDYVTDLPCKVKETLSLDGMVSLIKQRNRALVILERVKSDGKSEEQALNTTFKVQITTPNGVQVTDQKVSDLLNGTKKLDELQAHCKGCFASGGRAFGCYKNIQYPISARAEEWLAGMTRKAADSNGPGILPVQFMIEGNVNDGPFGRMRAASQGNFLELKKPLEIVIGNGIFNKKKVNTDQVLNLLMGMGRMKGTHMKMLLYFSGALNILNAEPRWSTPQLALQMTDDKGQKTWWTYDMKNESTDDRSTLALKEYFRSLFTAYCLNRDMLIDV